MAPGKACVFVIDDDASVRRALHRVITLAGYDVEALGSAEEYLHHAVPPRPACLVLDVRMPGMGGLELQGALRATPHDRPIVFVTSHKDDQTCAQALALGAVAVLDKPVDSADLLDAIDVALKAC